MKNPLLNISFLFFFTALSNGAAEASCRNDYYLAGFSCVISEDNSTLGRVTKEAWIDSDRYPVFTQRNHLFSIDSKWKNFVLDSLRGKNNQILTSEQRRSFTGVWQFNQVTENPLVDPVLWRRQKESLKELEHIAAVLSEEQTNDDDSGDVRITIASISPGDGKIKEHCRKTSTIDRSFGGMVGVMRHSFENDHFSLSCTVESINRIETNVSMTCDALYDSETTCI